MAIGHVQELGSSFVVRDEIGRTLFTINGGGLTLGSIGLGTLAHLTVTLVHYSSATVTIQRGSQIFVYGADGHIKSVTFVPPSTSRTPGLGVIR